MELLPPEGKQYRTPPPRPPSSLTRTFSLYHHALFTRWPMPNKTQFETGPNTKMHKNCCCMSCSGRAGMEFSENFRGGKATHSAHAYFSFIHENARQMGAMYVTRTSIHPVRTGYT